MQRSNRENDVLSVGTLKGLRNLYSESQTVRYGEGSIEERTKNMNVDTHNAVLRMFQRGQSPSHSDSMYMMSSQINLLSQSLEERGVNPELIKKEHVAEAAGILNLTMGDSDLEKAMFTQALFMDDELGSSGFSSLKESTAAMTHGVMGMFEQLHTEKSSEAPDENRVEVLTSMLHDVVQDGRPRLDRYRQMRAQMGTKQAVVSKTQLDTDLEKLTKKPFGRSVQDKQMRARQTGTLLDPDAGLEAVGAFAVPALMIALGSGAALDERVGLAALDTFQSIAYMNTNKGSRTSEFLGDSSEKANFRYTGARVRDAMEQEGIVSGGIQSVIQESLFRGGSQMVYKAIDAVNTRMGGNKRKAGNAIATIAAETISTVAALSFARSRVKAKNSEGGDMPDRISDILKAFSEEVWKNVERAQQALSDPTYEVLDTTENQQTDFDLNAVPTELEQDMITGLVVLDEDGNNLNIRGFDSADSEESALVSSFG